MPWYELEMGRGGRETYRVRVKARTKTEACEMARDRSTWRRPELLETPEYSAGDWVPQTWPVEVIEERYRF